MMTYSTLSTQTQSFLAMTGLTPAEFRVLLPAFEAAYERAYPLDQTADGRTRQRWPGAGRRSILERAEDKLLFVLVYLKTYPIQALLGQLFGISTSQANHWLHCLLPMLRSALDDLGVAPERDGPRLARRRGAPESPATLIIDGTERRRQRPKNTEKQAGHYSGKKKTHTDKNVVVTSAADDRVLFLSGTYPGAANDKRIADEEGLRYPPGTTLYKDAGFQGYEPPVQQTCQAKKKATGGRTDRRGEGGEPQAGATTGPRGARHRWREAQSDCQRRVPEQKAGGVR
jgi:Helix-turn-helix of DDE superfamily endonuclease/DDE superfamily endonuclease